MADPKISTPPPAPTKPATPAPDAGHVPITEEFDRAKWTLPPWQVVAIALVGLAVIVGLVSWMFVPKPGVNGSIDDVAAARVTDTSVLVTVRLTLNNPNERSFYIRSLKAHLKTDSGEWDDNAASPIDFERYFQGFPELRQHANEPLAVETRIPPGGQQKGTIIVAFPVSKEVFEKRQSISVTVEPYDQKPVVITKQ